MTFRQLLNVTYAALALGHDDAGIEALDAELEADPEARVADAPRRRPTGNIAALMAAASLPQVGAPVARPEGGAR